MKKETETSAAAKARKRALIRSLIERTQAADEEREVALPFADNVEVVFTDPVPVMEVRLAENDMPLAEVIPFPRGARG